MALQDRPQGDPEKVESLFDNPTFSDMKVRFHGRELHAHKAILANHSMFFHKAMIGSFKESITGILELGDEDDEMALMAMFSFLYYKPYAKVSYLRDGVAITSDADDPVFHAKVFAVADKYSVPSLRSTIAEEFSDILWSAFDSHWDAADLLPVIATIWTPIGDKALQPIMAEFCAKHEHKCMENPDFVELLDIAPCLAVSMCKKLHQVTEFYISRDKCAECSTQLGGKNICTWCSHENWLDPRDRHPFR